MSLTPFYLNHAIIPITENFNLSILLTSLNFQMLSLVG